MWWCKRVGWCLSMGAAYSTKCSHPSQALTLHPFAHLLSGYVDECIVLTKIKSDAPQNYLLLSLKYHRNLIKNNLTIFCLYFPWVDSRAHPAFPSCWYHPLRAPGTYPLHMRPGLEVDFLTLEVETEVCKTTKDKSEAESQSCLLALTPLQGWKENTDFHSVSWLSTHSTLPAWVAN